MHPRRGEGKVESHLPLLLGKGNDGWTHVAAAYSHPVLRR
jgi:hypothetical protein